jgi:hypothetical protein
MTCNRVERENLVERYVSGRLEPDLNELFERHYFDCEECAEKVETWLAIAGPLRDMAPEIRREMAHEMARESVVTMPPPRSRGWAGAAAIAAGVLVVVGVSLLPRMDVPAPVSAPVVAKRDAGLTELARLDPPAYAAPDFRGAETTAETRFREAMSAYLQRDYERAIGGLKSSLALDPTAAAPRFFLGACELLTGRNAEGIRDLEQAAASGSPFAEEARFDLAKGYLMAGRREEAVAALRFLESQGGEFAVPARRLADGLSGKP